MTTKKLYIQGDLSSSPYEPMIGSLVLFRPAQNSSNGLDLRPGIITNVCNTADDRVDITVFTPQGVVHYRQIPYSMDPTRSGSWQWCKQPERRDIASAPDTQSNKSSGGIQHSPSGEGGKNVEPSHSDSSPASKEAVSAG